MLSTGMARPNERYRASQTLELPKISRTFACSQYRSSLSFPCIARELDYSLLSTHQIQHQYNILRKQLVDLNGFMARKVEPLKYMPMRKTHQLQGQLSKDQISQQELNNNLAILQRLHLELSSLQDRLQQISLVDKGEMNQEIQKAKKDIKGAKASIKQMELRVSQKGRSIQNNDQVFEAIAFLQMQKSRIELKRRMMEQHSQKVLSETQTLRDKIASIANESASAQSMLMNFDQTLKQDTAREVQNGKLRQKQQEKKALYKNIDSLKSIKEHQLRNLKEKERIIRESLLEQESRIEKVVGVLQIRKKELLQLQRMLNEIFENQHLGRDKAEIFNCYTDQHQIKMQSGYANKATIKKKPQQSKKSLQKNSIRQQNKTIQVVPPKLPHSSMKSSYSFSKKKAKESSVFIPFEIPSIDPSQIHEKDKEKKMDNSQFVDNKLEKQRIKNKFINVRNQNQQEVLPAMKKQQGKFESKKTEKKQQSLKEVEQSIKKQQENKKQNMISSKKGKEQISKEGKEGKEPEREESQYYEQESQFEDLISSSQQSEKVQKEDAQFEQKVQEQRQKMSRGVKVDVEIEGIKQLKLGEEKVRKNHFTIEL